MQRSTVLSEPTGEPVSPATGAVGMGAGGGEGIHNPKSRQRPLTLDRVCEFCSWIKIHALCGLNCHSPLIIFKYRLPSAIWVSQTMGFFEWRGEKKFKHC